MRVENKNYLLMMLVLIGVISYFDRFVFALAFEPIKQDLGLTDSQLGLMSGFAFAAFYAVAGIPIARWSDRGNRITISALSVGLLGLAVSLCGLVTHFFHLLLARAGVAIGEAGSVPAAQSLIADNFNREERPRAMSIYFMNFTISMIVGYVLGGWLIESLGWRTTFIVIGIPGVVVALLAKLSLTDKREFSKAENNLAGPGMLETLSLLWQQQSFRYILIGFCFAYFFSMGVNQWLATFFIRTHGLTSTELGLWLALSWGVFGSLGNYLGGFYASRFAAGREKKQLRMLALVMCLNVLANMMIYLSPTKTGALIFVALTACLSTFANGPIFSAIQSVVSDRLRSVSVALIFFFANLVGFGLGPFALGVLSDALNPSYGQDSLRYALLIFSPGFLLIAYYHWKASNVIEQDILAVEELANTHKEHSDLSGDKDKHSARGVA